MVGTPHTVDNSLTILMLIWDHPSEKLSPLKHGNPPRSRLSLCAMKKLGKFEILAKVGQGAMGVVYKARDPFIDRIVALKTLTTGFAEDPHHLKRFYSEARSAGSLRHPNIVTIFELGHEGDTPFIAMQFLNGESLDKVIDRMPNLPLSQKVGFIVHVCRALEYAHKQNPPVVHRDVKPGNVMISPDGCVVVVDFGIARLGESTVSQSKGLLIGTLGYMAPQLFRGGTADARSDIWATGVMFYELLAYRRPFKGENAAALMSNIILEEHRSITEAAPGTPDDVKRILDRMLAKEIESRYQSMEEVLSDLEPVWQRLLQSDVSILLENSRRLYQEGDLLAAKSEILQILAWDPANSQAKSLADKIAAEVRRQQIVPQLKLKVENAQKMLANGNPEKARAEAESALRLDSSFQPAQEVLAQARAAIERAREIDVAIRTSRQRMAEGSLTEAETQLDKVFALDPENEVALDQRKLIQHQRTTRERQKEHENILERARALLNNLQYDECIDLLHAAIQQFPSDHDILKLLDAARRDQLRSKEKQDLLKQRVREVEWMIERQQLTEAVDLARQTISTVGRDPRLADTLAKAEREIEFREQKKREQDARLQAARALLAENKLNDLATLIREALESHLFPVNDPRIEKLFEEIEAGVRQQPMPSSLATETFAKLLSDSRTGDPAKDYVFMRPAGAPDAPTHVDQNATSATASAATTGLGATPSTSSKPSGSATPPSPAFVPSGLQSEPWVLGLDSSGSVPAAKPHAAQPPPPVSSSAWHQRNPQFLGAVEKHLAAFLGPIAGIVTRKTASQAKNPNELFSLLAQSLPTESDRNAFLARKDDLLRRFPRVQQIPASAPAVEPAATAVQTPAASPARAQLTPAAVRRAAELMAPYVGPVARVLVERAAPRAESLRGLYLLLAEHLHDRTERARFLSQAGFPES
jgi:serine/threonine protein kinase